MANHIFMATSLDGYIADKANSVAWLEEHPQDISPEAPFTLFMENMDAIIMGRGTFESVHAMGLWPYSKPVIVMSQSLQSLPSGYQDKATLTQDTIKDVLLNAFRKGYQELYIDGAKLVQSFLKKDFIDSITITQIPIVLGGGVALFGELPEPLKFNHIHTQVLEGGLVMSGYMRKR